MTFIISYLSDNGISMASDSNYTKSISFESAGEYPKTEFFPDFNYGVSIWGRKNIRNKVPFWDWFKEQQELFFKEKTNLNLFIKNIVNELNEILPAVITRGTNNKNKYRLGIHLCLYENFNGENRPVLYHITNNRENGEFDDQKDCYPLEKGIWYLQFNGLYLPFSGAVNDFRDYKEKVSFRFNQYIQKNLKIAYEKTESRRLLEKECEFIVSTIRQYQALTEMLNIKPLIGGPINAICFNQDGLVKKYDVRF